VISAPGNLFFVDRPIQAKSSTSRGLNGEKYAQLARPTRVAENERDAERTIFLSLSLSLSFLALCSLGVLLREVPLHVQREMIAPGERTLADRAFKGLSPGVFAVMPRQFVASGESPLAFRPLTLIRLLA